MKQLAVAEGVAWRMLHNFFHNKALLIEGWDLGQLALGFAIALALMTIGMFAASRALKTRLVRT